MRLIRELQRAELLPVTFDKGGYSAPSYQEWRRDYLAARNILPSLAQDAWVAEPRPFFASGPEFWLALRGRREQPIIEGFPVLSVQGQATQLGISRKFLRILETNPVIQPAESLLQSAALLYSLRYNYLSFDGGLLSSSREIEQDLIRRALTLGFDLSSEEFTAFAGQSFAALKKSIKAGKATDEPILGILQSRFRMRILKPFQIREVMDDKTLGQFLREFDRACDAWHLTQDELMTIMGRTSVANWRKYRAAPCLYQKITRDVCALVGVKWHQTSQPEPRQGVYKPFFFNAELATAIKSEMVRRKITDGFLCKTLSEKHGHSFQGQQLRQIIQKLRDSKGQAGLVKDQQLWLTRVAHELEIPLFCDNPDEPIKSICSRLPKIDFYCNMGSIPNDSRNRLGELLQKIRSELNIPITQLAHEIQAGVATALAIEAGRIQARNLETLKRYCELFQIELHNPSKIIS